MTESATPFGIAAPRYRLPHATRVGRVHLQVASLERSVGFYTQVLGLREGTREPGRVALHAAGDPQPLIELHEKAGVAQVPRRGAFGLYHVAILVPTRAALGQFIAHLVALGVRFGAADHLVSEAVYLTDPDGLGIEVYCDRPRSAWQTSGRELAMGTEVLDLASLVDAADDTAWTGTPAGTVIGHIHLHVGDLGRSDAFYHEALGFDRVVWSYPGASFLSAGGYHHHLGTNTWSAGPAATDDQARLLEWELRLPTAADVAAAAASLEQAGHQVQRAGDGSVLAADPWGTRLRLAA